MHESDIKRFIAPVTVGLVLNVIAAYIYDYLKPLTANGPWPFVIAVASIAVLNVVYSILLIRFVRQQDAKVFVRRSACLHSFAHNARNLAVKLMARKPAPYSGRDGEDATSITGDSHYQHKEDIVLLLESLANVFELMVPRGTKVWACIRERRTDDAYHTWARTSRCETTRQEFSEPLHKDSKTIQNLKKSYKENKDCVIITGSKLVEWHPMKNDEYSEDLSVLMGAVLSKSWGRNSFDDPKLNWIVCVNADRDLVFTREHINLMKACNDVFSWLLNTYIRYDAAKSNWPPAPRPNNPDITA